MSTIAFDQFALTRIADFARSLSRLHRASRRQAVDDDTIDREFNAVCMSVWGYTTDDFSDDLFSDADHVFLDSLGGEFGFALTLDDTKMIWNNKDRLTFHVARHSWSVPERHPILEDEYYDLYPLSVKLGFDPATLKEARRFSIGWEIKTPKALPKCCGLKLTVEATAPRVGTSYLTLEAA